MVVLESVTVGVALALADTVVVTVKVGDAVDEYVAVTLTEGVTLSVAGEVGVGDALGLAMQYSVSAAGTSRQPSEVMV